MLHVCIIIIQNNIQFLNYQTNQLLSIIYKCVCVSSVNKKTTIFIPEKNSLFFTHNEMKNKNFNTKKT